jgi:hypothetical protein
MKKISVYDLVNNIQPDDYEKFALDDDLEDSDRLFEGSAATDTTPTQVFIVKVDENNSDFLNEEFMIRFKTANTMYKYLRFKAVFQTQNSSVTPFLGNYRIKIGS